MAISWKTRRTVTPQTRRNCVAVSARAKESPCSFHFRKRAGSMKKLQGKNRRSTWQCRTTSGRYSDAPPPWHEDSYGHRRNSKGNRCRDRRSCICTTARREEEITPCRKSDGRGAFPSDPASIKGKGLPKAPAAPARSDTFVRTASAAAA